MATIERHNLAPLNPGTVITEADRSKVYDIIGRKLADVLSGNQSYYPDGRQKDSQARAEDLNDFIPSIKDLQSHVDDRSNILGEAVSDLRKHAQAFQEITKENEPTGQYLSSSRIISDHKRQERDIHSGPWSIFAA